MKNLTQLFLITILLLGVSCSKFTESTKQVEPSGEKNRAYQLGKIALECTANDTEKFKPRPTVTSRILALTWTAIFDAWTRYDDKASPMFLLNVERRPESQRTLANKEIAITYAAYRTMQEYYFSDTAMLRKKMIEFKLDPNNNSLDPETPAGIGNLAAKAVIESRLDDGSNQRGAIANSDGSLYADYTGYNPVNTADQLTDISRWQPKYFSDGNGGKFAPQCLTPHWGKVKPLVLKSSDQFRPGPPPMIGTQELVEQVKEVVDLQSNLTNEQKALVEFMRDGPRSVQQAGHWFIFAQNVSIRDNHTLDHDVKMYFLLEATAMDAFIAAWDTKMHYDFARPYALVHNYYKDKQITGWGGPSKGWIKMKGQEWRPYSPDAFLCPAFPSYVSGHSCVSGACAETLKLFTGSDRFGERVKLIPGSMTEPENLGDTVTLEFPTFTKTADMAGMSRVLGGYHIQADNVEGLKLGRNVAGEVWKKYNDLVNGKSTNPAPIAEK
jgi:hypothetical protein